jgi:hypothetical protein
MRGSALPLTATIAGNARSVFPHAICIRFGDIVVVDERWF